MPLYIVNYSDEGECILHVGHFIVAEVQCIVVILSEPVCQNWQARLVRVQVECIGSA